MPAGPNRRSIRGMRLKQMAISMTSMASGGSPFIPATRVESMTDPFSVPGKAPGEARGDDEGDRSGPGGFPGDRRAAKITSAARTGRNYRQRKTRDKRGLFQICHLLAVRPFGPIQPRDGA